jgi:hypothetical protein
MERIIEREFIVSLSLGDVFGSGKKIKHTNLVACRIAEVDESVTAIESARILKEDGARSFNSLSKRYPFQIRLIGCAIIMLSLDVSTILHVHAKLSRYTFPYCHIFGRNQVQMTCEELHHIIPLAMRRVRQLSTSGPPRPNAPTSEEY